MLEEFSTESFKRRFGFTCPKGIDPNDFRSLEEFKVKFNSAFLIPGTKG
jgi:hypothetical protein